MTKTLSKALPVCNVGGVSQGMMGEEAEGMLVSYALFSVDQYLLTF